MSTSSSITRFETMEQALGAAGVTPDTLSAADRARLDRDGYVVIADALAPEHVDALRQAFDAAAGAEAGGARGTQHVAIVPARALAGLRIAANPVLLAAAWHVLGRPFRVSRLHGRNPQPGYGQQGLHADWMPRARGEPFHVVTCLYMLDDFTPDNGATRVVPGSHLWHRALPKAQLQPTAHHPDEVIVTGRAGSALIFNGHLLHAGTCNRSPRPRRAIQTICVARDGHRLAEHGDVDLGLELSPLEAFLVDPLGIAE